MLSKVKHNRVRYDDFQSKWYRERASELRFPLDRIHRWNWECSVIIQIYLDLVDTPGPVIGFGVGVEPMSAWFASKGVQCLATDQEVSEEAIPWISTNRHAATIESTIHLDICPPGWHRKFVEFQHVDMRDIPSNLFDKFAFSWSCGSLEHLGSRQAGLDFFVNQMSCLRPGGIAAHTTELVCFGSQPFDSRDLSFYCEEDLEILRDRLAEQGDVLYPLNLTPGNDYADTLIDHPPYDNSTHLVLEACGCNITSVLLVAKRGGV